MKCEFDYCIYNRDFLCTLRKIQISSIGMCEDCIMISVPAEDLKLIKERQLKETGEAYGDG